MYLCNGKTPKDKWHLRVSVYFTEEVTFKEHRVHAVGTGTAINSIHLKYNHNGTLCLVVDYWHYYPLEKIKYICMKELDDNYEDELWCDIIGQNKIRNIYDRNGETTLYLE